MLAPLPMRPQTKAKKEADLNNEYSAVVDVRYMIDDVDAAVAFYTKHFGFTVEVDSAPAFASVTRGNLRLLLSGEKSSGRRPMPDGSKAVPGGWNRILLRVSDIKAEVARLRAAGVRFRRDDILSGPGGSQIWVVDPSGNLVELFQPEE
jgi:catechol 2,3-dioxygenase-like lactoylglutathione lyase family enzyme